MEVTDGVVPRSATEVTGEWLAEAIGADARFRGARWPDIEMTRIGEGFGLDGVLVRAQVPGSTTRSIIVKLSDWTANHDEPDFYLRIAPEMPIRLPECYGILRGGGRRLATSKQHLSRQ